MISKQLSVKFIRVLSCFRLYCRHYERTFKSPEEELSYFLERVAKPGWRWPAKPRPPEHHRNKGHERHNNGNYCEDHLTKVAQKD